MKRLSHIIAALVMLLSLPADARTIHWLTFIDTTDGNVGEIDKFGREILYSRFIGLVNAALLDKGYETSIHDVYGPRLTPKACKNEVENLKVGPDDIVVFYYIGHGGRSTDDVTEWPQMMMAQNYDEGFIPLLWVHNTLKAKNPRLTVTIGMCCNSYTRGLTAKTSPMFTPNFGNTYMSQSEIYNLAKLFDDYEGDLILSSSTPGQPSGCLEFTDGKVIDAFTGCLTVATNDLMAGEIAPGWKSFFNTVGDMVTKYSMMQRNQKQNIQFQDNTSRKSAPAQEQQIEKPEEQQVPSQNERIEAQESSSSRDEVVGYFNNLFNGLINRRLSDDERIAIAESFCENNRNITGVQILTLGQDSDNVLGRQNLEDFIGRLATTRIMQSVSVVDIDGDNIKVREIFRR